AGEQGQRERERRHEAQEAVQHARHRTKARHEKDARARLLCAGCGGVRRAHEARASAMGCIAMTCFIARHERQTGTMTHASAIVRSMLEITGLLVSPISR